MSITSVLPEIDDPEPTSPVIVKAIDYAGRKVKFDATQEAIREIRRKGLGILRQSPESGWCVLIVNRCYRFRQVVNWMEQLQTISDEEESEAA